MLVIITCQGHTQCLDHHYLSEFSQQSYQVSTTVPVLQTQNPRHWKVNGEFCRAGKWGNVCSLKVAVILASSQPHLWHGICCSSSQFCFLSSCTDCCGGTLLQSSPRLLLLSFSRLERISYTGQRTLLKPTSGVTSLLKMTEVSLLALLSKKRKAKVFQPFTIWLHQPFLRSSL